MIKVQAWNEFVSPKFYGPLANWPWLRISHQSSLFVIYCLILTAWQWLMSFTCVPVQIEPNKSLLRKRLLFLLLSEIIHFSSPSRSCLGRLILICGRWGALRAKLPNTSQIMYYNVNKYIVEIYNKDGQVVNVYILKILLYLSNIVRKLNLRSI